MTRLFLDFETFSRCDLRTHGLDRYARHESTRALMLAYAFGKAEVQQVVFAEGQGMPQDLLDALRDPTVIKSAWNAQFERNIFAHVLGIVIPYDQWQCSMAHALSLSLPASLGKAGQVMDLDSDHLKMESRGKTLIKKFCVPRKPTKVKPWDVCGPATDPKDWEDFKLYNRRDVEAERASLRKMMMWPMPAVEQQIYQMDQEINDKGIPINVDMVDNAAKVYNALIDNRLARMKELTGVDNPNSTSQLLDWLMKEGYPFQDMKKGHVTQALEMVDEQCKDEHMMDGFEPPVMLEVLEHRSEVSRTSPKKYISLQDTVDREDGVVRNVFQYGGAQRTLRWAGRMYQPHNLPRPAPWFEDCQEASADLLTVCDASTIDLLYDKPFDLLASCVRPASQAKPGYVYCDADLNAIENRGIGWICNDGKILQVFHDKKDPYIDFCWRWLGGSYEQRWHQFKVEKNKSFRTLSKPPVLGCGYRLGAGEVREDRHSGELTATGLLGYAWALGVKTMTKEDSASAVKAWREEYVEVVKFWSDVEQAAWKALRTGREIQCGPVSFDMSGPFLRMRLPSGRCIHYCRPSIEKMPVPWAADDSRKDRDTLCYWGMNDKNQWALDTTHGGKLLENCLSADTMLLTPSGPKPIIDVSPLDMLWDGEHWVAHDGLFAHGYRETIEWGPGIRLTPEHRILVDNNWIEAKDTSYEHAVSSFLRHDRTQIRLPDGSKVRGVGREKVVLGDPLRLREDDQVDGGVFPERSAEVLRLHARCCDSGISDIPRDVCSSGVLGMAVDARSLSVAESPGVSQLRRAWDQSLRVVEQFIRGFLGGHGANVSGRLGHRSQGQHGGVLSGELPLGDAKEELSQQEDQYSYRDATGVDAGLRSQRDFGDQRDHSVVSQVCGLAGRTDVRCTRLSEPVYDVLNAGPLRRFTVVGADGSFVIVHNCTQAMSRDVLAHGMLLARKEGLDIRLHVHDQICVMVKENEAEEKLKVLIQCMSETPSWAPGLPLAAEGSISRYFVKD